MINTDVMTATAMPTTPGRTVVRAPAGDIPSQHWQGGPVNCGVCDYADLRALPGRQGCEPGHACMQDVYARRIDRFFRWHPALGNEQIGHAYFEVRAIAARYASVFRLTTLMDDPDYGVRELVALHLPLAILPTMATDSDRAVRMRVAQRLEMPALLRMADDTEPEVRRIVAQRLPAPLLSRLLSDTDWRVRWEVAQRADAATLDALRDDEDAEVRQTARERQARDVTRMGVIHG